MCYNICLLTLVTFSATKNITRNLQNGIIETSRVSVTQMELDGEIMIVMGRIENERIQTKIIIAASILHQETVVAIITNLGDKCEDDF